MTEHLSPPADVETPLETPGSPERSQVAIFRERLVENRLAFAGFILFVLFFITAVLGLMLTAGHRPVLDPATIRLEETLKPPLSLADKAVLSPERIPPTGRYLLGTDDLGRDIFARMLQGAWVSLTVGFVAVGISVAMGIFLGGIAGYYGPRFVRLGHLLSFSMFSAGIGAFFLDRPAAGATLLAVGLAVWATGRRPHAAPARQSRTATPARLFAVPVFSVDALIMRFVDIMLCFPSFFLILTVVAILPASIYNIMVVIGLTSWMGTARFVRAEFLSLRERDFVAAARALSVGDFRIIFRHMMPNAVAPVLVSATIGIATAILTEAGLSFLGFGVPPPYATWGNILSDGRRFIFDAPWLTFAPGIVILIVVLAFNLFGEGLREALNPNLREKK